MKKYNFAVYATQGGGVVREVNGSYVFVEAPPLGMGLGIGDIMPEEWGIIPVNQQARNESNCF